jgi:3',5'-cyclic AMP phosphodiesterase CpdA
MKKIKLIHIGDVHYPESHAMRLLDHKDKGFPAAFSATLSAGRLKAVTQKVIALTESDNDIRGVLISGDLTDRGSLPGYTDCVEYLRTALRIGDPAGWAVDEVHVVPGNHDVDRSLCNPGTVGDFHTKFVPLRDAWSAHGLDILATGAPRATSVTHYGNSARLISVNSCIGCGEHRFLPERIRSQLANVLSPHAANPLDPAAFDTVAEQLDTPAFLDDHLGAIVNEVNRCRETRGVPIILAHHNILPQAIPRVDVYTEVINGGLARSRLSSLGTAVIYCHGHIHADPVEVIMRPDSSRSRLVIVSAPLFREGFNLIEIEFGRNRVSLGCTIRRFRLEDYGEVNERSDPIRVPLNGPSDPTALDDDYLRLVVRAATRETRRFSEIVDAARTATGTTHPQPQIAEALLEAEWLGFVTISDRTENFKYWQIRRIEP